ncbi:MAG TPA: tetratricopeptide repeat protein, partial [Kofleriaceae bacterium]|nr:tetratricopeptide repeat protein [Kofleriaceae bacterium]
WPAVYAEALYAEGGAEGKIGDSSRASETLKLAAAAAEKAHHDRVAAGAWTQLISSATFADNDVERALEYATYADAALDRIGRPPLDEMLLLYYHGAALAQAERTDDAEAKMRAALRLAEQHDPSKVPLIVQGLGFLYDAKGEYKKAVDMYREAIATSKEPRSSIAVFHAQLAMNLAMHGERELALVHANTAVTDATDGVDPRNDEWQTIKGARILVLRHLGRFEEALADIPAAQARASAARGRRSDDVALYEQLEAVLLADVGKISEAEPLIRRACETLAIAMGEGSIDHAGCLADQAAIELRAGHLAPAHAHAEHAIQIVEQVQNFHADVAVLYQVRGEVARRRGDRAKAAADFDRAIAMCPPYADPGYLASAHFAKARLFADSDPTAAKDLLQRAITAWQPDAGMWKRELGEAQALLAKLSR